jgi:phenylacetic acid degradation operon negative regulatory protein
MPGSDPSPSNRRPPPPGPGRPFDDDVDQVLEGLSSTSGRLPRRQTGSAPQNLTVTLMADFTLRPRAWMASAAIVALLAEFDVSGSNARTAISRLARRGVLEADKLGRNTFYRLSAPSAANLVVAGRHLAGHPAEAEAWDGRWTLVAFSLPHDHGAERRALRGQLRWQGFAPLYDGLWIHPAPLDDDGAASLLAIAPTRVTVFRGDLLSFSGTTGRRPLDAWDLAGLAARYRAFVDTWQARRAEPGFHRTSGRAALLTRSAVIEDYRLLPLLDPVVPLAEMPAGWPRRAAHETLSAVYDGLARAALDHVNQVVAEATGTPPPALVTHTVAEMAAGLDPVDEGHPR